MMLDNISYIDEDETDLATVEFTRETHYITNLEGEVIDTREDDFITIRTPGDPLNVIKTVVDESHKRRFQSQWAQYKGLEEAGRNGTPIEQWEGLHENMKKVFTDLGFSTVEQVAMASENAFNRIMGGYSWKMKARQYLEKAAPRNNERLSQLEADNAELRAMVQQLMTKKAS